MIDAISTFSMSQPNTPSSDTNQNHTPSSISAAAHAYQLAMQTNSHSATSPASSNSSVLQMPGATRDVVMEDAPLHRPAVCLILPPDPVPPVPHVVPSSHPSIGHFLSLLSSAVEILTHTTPSQSPAASMLPQNTPTQSQSPPILPPTHQSNSTPVVNVKADALSPVPVPARTSTPIPKVNGNAENTSRATSQHPDMGQSLPTEASSHGAPARVYLNQTVTGSLLEGMKLLAKEQYVPRAF